VCAQSVRRQRLICHLFRYIFLLTLAGYQIAIPVGAQAQRPKPGAEAGADAQAGAKAGAKAGPGSPRVTVPSTSPLPSDELLARLPDVFRLATSQYQSLLNQIKSSVDQPRSFSNGALKLVGPKDWTSGFFAGSLWLLYEYTEQPNWRAAARDYTYRVESIKYFRGDHDVGFILNCSFGNGYRLTQERHFRKVLIHGARSLATRFNPQVGMIRSWDFGAWQYPVIVDNLMNLELLTWAARASGETRLRDIALLHADNTLKHHFRDDGSSVHLVDFEPKTGAVKKKQTVQGAADSSSWSRGQAWALYGYTLLFRETGKVEYLAQAQRIARFISHHARLPLDKIPYWDFDAPEIPNTQRDVAAAAIMASALLELSTFTEPELSQQYRLLARQQLLALSSPNYLARPGENGGFLLMHAVGNRPNNIEVDAALNYADYYFLEALLRYRKLAAK
jgi:unsaturated chondroitin disaccharide hydrolase